MFLYFGHRYRVAHRFAPVSEDSLRVESRGSSPTHSATVALFMCCLLLFFTAGTFLGACTEALRTRSHRSRHASTCALGHHAARDGGVARNDQDEKRRRCFASSPSPSLRLRRHLPCAPQHYERPSPAPKKKNTKRHPHGKSASSERTEERREE